MTTKKTDKTDKKRSGKDQQAKPQPLTIDNDMRRLLLTLKSAWTMNPAALSSKLSLLNEAELKRLFDVVKTSAYKSTYIEILHEAPALREFIHNDRDRFFLLDIYEYLSWKLRLSVKVPPRKALVDAMSGPIGRDSAGSLRF